MNTLPLWVSVVLGTISIAGAIFAVSVFIVRTKDMNELRPVIERLPMMEQKMDLGMKEIKDDVADLKKDVAEVKGAVSVIPAVQEKLAFANRDIDDLRARVLNLEARR